MLIDDLPDEVLEACRKRKIPDEEITGMTARELFYHYCQWNGLIQWGHKLYDLAHELAEIPS